MPIRTASARWEGNLTEGSGTVKTGKGGLQGNYSFKSRFEEGEGTNPEELIAAAHSACFSMALSHALAQKGNAPQQLDVEAAVDFTPGKGITGIHLTVQGQVDGIDNDGFVKAAQDAKENCPVSQALTGTTITLDASLR